MFDRLRLSTILMLMMLPLMMAYAYPEKTENSLYGIMLKGLLSNDVPSITVGELRRNREEYVLIDAREEEEFEVSRLSGAINIPLAADSSLRYVPSDLDKQTPVVVYCSVGYRSEKLTELLLANGFQDVRNLYGGIFEWVNRGYEVENDSGITDKVHAYSPFWGVWLRAGERVYE